MANTTADLKTVLKIRPFRRLWTVLGLASFGDWLALFATAGFAQSLFDNPAAKGAAFSGTIVLRLLPSLLLGPVAGVFADRFDRRKTMAACDTARFLLIASVPTVYIVTDSTAITVAWLAVSQILIEGAVLIWSPAKEAAVPNLLPPQQYETANQLSLATTYGLAPPLAFGVLAVLESGAAVWSNIGPWADPMVLALYLTAAMFAILAATVYFLIPQISGRDGAAKAKSSVWADFIEGWTYLRGRARVRGLVTGMLGAFSGAGILIGVGTFYAADIGADDDAFYLLAVFLFLGLGAGIATGPKLVRELSRLRWFGMSIVLAGVGLAADALAPWLWVSLIGSVVIGLGAGMAFLAGITLLQREVEDEIRGRMFAFIAVSARVILMVSMTAAAPLAGWHAARQLDLGFTVVQVSMARVLLFVAAVLVAWLGVVAFRRMDDKPGVPVLADLWSSLRGRPLSAAVPTDSKGFFVAFEGGEGAGKSTQSVKLSAWLKLRGYEAVLTREPGATDIGMRIRTLLLDSSGGDTAPAPRAEALLYAADRAQHVDKVIRPALERGAVVVSDRYIDSSIAYQGSGRSLGRDEIAWVSKWATGGLKPDLTVVLDVEPEAGLTRAKAGGEGDRLEQEDLLFHERVRRTFLDLADKDPKRYLVVPAGGTPDEIAATVRDAVAERLDIRTEASRTETRWPGLETDGADPKPWASVAEEAGRP